MIIGYLNGQRGQDRTERDRNQEEKQRTGGLSGGLADAHFRRIEHCEVGPNVVQDAVGGALETQAVDQEKREHQVREDGREVHHLQNYEVVHMRTSFEIRYG